MGEASLRASQTAAEMRVLQRQNERSSKISPNEHKSKFLFLAYTLSS